MEFILAFKRNFHYKCFLFQMWSNGTRCTDQDQGHNWPNLDLQKVMSRGHLWVMCHEHWWRKHSSLSVVGSNMFSHIHFNLLICLSKKKVWGILHPMSCLCRIFNISHCLLSEDTFWLTLGKITTLEVSVVISALHCHKNMTLALHGDLMKVKVIYYLEII